ncbi:TraR/DksA family transcriptional regulator [Micromonospora sp. CPCC 206061]|uniref:TraR/DksA family transcriptional regulator n=1 Tax=Micromonospora sp. CPCC 206061 TaxID=3122410 RepID=UPI002FF2749C
MSVSAHDRLHTLRNALQDQFERYTHKLTTLTAHGTAPEHEGFDRQTAVALIDSTRQALADTTQALKRMTEGTYGRCEQCQLDIPVERLEILPHARFCVPCQQTQHR